MSQSLADLRQHATECANQRGHVIRWIAPHLLEPQSTSQGHCTQCDAWVQINTNPQTNQIGIGGPAVALDCPVKMWR